MWLTPAWPPDPTAAALTCGCVASHLQAAPLLTTAVGESKTNQPSTIGAAGPRFWTKTSVALS